MVFLVFCVLFALNRKIGIGLSILLSWLLAAGGIVQLQAATTGTRDYGAAWVIGFVACFIAASIALGLHLGVLQREAASDARRKSAAWVWPGCMAITSFIAAALMGQPAENFAATALIGLPMALLPPAIAYAWLRLRAWPTKAAAYPPDAYRVAGDEVLGGTVDPALWAEAMVAGGGNDGKVKARYIELRLAALHQANAETHVAPGAGQAPPPQQRIAGSERLEPAVQSGRRIFELYRRHYGNC